jgi:hypothetical protein
MPDNLSAEGGHMGNGNAVRRIWRLTTATALIAGSLALPASSVFAADAIDQSNTASGDVNFVHDVITAAQTFTAGRTGSLNRVDLSVGRLDVAGTLTVRIETASAGVPSGTVLAAATVAAALVPDDGDLHDISVALPPTLVTAGQQYAVVLAALAAKVDTAWTWPTDSADAYAGGTAVEGDTNAGTWTIHATDDRTFTTWVDSTPCAGGSYSVTGFGPCVPADPGNFATGPGATSQTPCATGTFQPAGGSAACDPAPIGSYVDTTGATAAIPCPDGTTTAAEGATSLADCQALTPPTIACAATPSVLWPPNGKLVAVTVNVTTVNATGFRLVSATADAGVATDLAGWTVGSADTAGQLRATLAGSADGRTYSLVYEASNDAGATADCTLTVTVPRVRSNR